MPERQALLAHLPPGTRFRVDNLGLTGTLLSVNECRAAVRLDAPTELVDFVDHEGVPRAFVAWRSRETSWTPAVLVTVLGREDLDMTTKKTTKKATKKQATKAAAKKTATKKTAADKPAAKQTRAEKEDGKLSAIDAAAKVLAEAGEPLTTKQMIEQMAAKGYWTSPGGKTPSATLYSSILRELQKKGTESRFQKTDRGHFTINAAAGAATKSAAKTTGKQATKKKAGKSKIADGTPGPQAVSELFQI